MEIYFFTSSKMIIKKNVLTKKKYKIVNLLAIIIWLSKLSIYLKENDIAKTELIFSIRWGNLNKNEYKYFTNKVKKTLA